ncbi:MAG: LysM peptidoglycan-binding domain-containing protein [Anaerolineales bacterium]|nr:LysM peptidoglycan-binding domain-containing protein [Anaerolineales bacterium]
MKHLLIVIGIASLILLGFSSQPAYASGETYIVQPGDTLFTIASRYGLSVDDLAAANGLNGNLFVYAGQQLVIPTTGPFLEPAAFARAAPHQAIDPRFVSFTPPPSSSFGTGRYIVQPGDTLYRIAGRYSIPVADLQAANRLSGFGASIYAGQELMIPGQALAPVSESLLYRPAVPALPRWDEVKAAPPVWRPYPAQQPTFYGPALADPYPAWPSRPNPAHQKWIDVNLTSQTLVAYEGQRPVFHTRVSTGIWQYPTIAGTFSIYVKYESADMSGGAGDEAYFLSSVPYVMYFHGNYGLHGTYWHNNFGRPMSHGCVNLPTPDAQWLFGWAPVGTKVVTHY